MYIRHTQVLKRMLKELEFEVQLREVQDSGLAALKNKGLSEDALNDQGFDKKIYVALSEEHEVTQEDGSTRTVLTLLHPVPDPAHLGKRAGRATNKAGQPTKVDGKLNGPPRPCLFRAARLAGVAALFPTLFVLESLMLTTGFGLDKQSELVQTAIFQNVFFREKVREDPVFGGPGPALMLELLGDVLLAMTRSRLSQAWRKRALGRFSDFFYLAMPESFFSRGEAPSRMLGMSTKILIDFKLLVDNTLTLMTLYPNIIISKLSSYACEKLWSQLVGIAGYKPNSHLLAAFLRKSIWKNQLLLDEERPSCVAQGRADRKHYAGGSVGSVKVTFNDESRLNPVTGGLDPTLFDKTGKEAKRRVAQTPQDASPREYNKKGRGGPPAASTTAIPLTVRWGVEQFPELTGAKAEVLAEGEWWNVKIDKVTMAGHVTYTYDGPLGDGDSGITESIKIGSILIRPPVQEESGPEAEDESDFRTPPSSPPPPSPPQGGKAARGKRGSPAKSKQKTHHR